MNEIKHLTFETMMLGNMVKSDPDWFDKNMMLINNAKVYVSRGADMYDPFSEVMTVALKTWVLKSPHPARRITVSAPKTWWDHFKLDVVPAFIRRFLRRWEWANWFEIDYGYETDYEYGPIYVCPHVNEKWLDNKSLHFEFLSDRDREGRR